MSKAKGAKSVWERIVTVILAALLVLTAAGGVVYLILSGQSAGLYVEYGGKRYYGNGTDVLTLRAGKEYEFAVGSDESETTDHSVAVQSNSANNFSFAVGDEYWNFYDTDSEKNDYTSLFGIEKTESGFTLSVSRKGLKELVEERFGGEVKFLSEPDAEAATFVLCVTCGGETVTLPLALDLYWLDLDPPYVVF